MTIYLYVKQHSKTGLKYFGRTISKYPYRYKGSGKYWKNHLKQHGNDIKTLELWEFEDQESATKFALKFSSDNNIVESNDWANLSIEDGKYGGETGHSGKPLSQEHRNAISKGLRKSGRTMSDEHKVIISQTHKNKTLSEQTKQKLREHNLGKKWSDEKRKAFSEKRKGGIMIRQVYVCPHCNKSGKGPNMKRYHFDNCKLTKKNPLDYSLYVQRLEYS